MLLAVRPYASPNHAADHPARRARRVRHRGRRARGLRAHVPAGRVPARGRARRRPAQPRRAVRGRARGGHRPVARPSAGSRPEEHGQAKVEAASLALILDLTRPWLWDGLDAGVQERVVDYLVVRRRRPQLPAEQLGLVPDRRRDVPAVGRRPVVGRGHRGGPRAARVVRARRRLVLRRRPSARYDHYVGWALHLYPVLWARMQGAPTSTPTRQARDVAPPRPLPAGRDPPGRRGRQPADPGPQPHLPVRRRRPVLGGRDRGRAQHVARAAAPRRVEHRHALRRSTARPTRTAC